MLTIAESIPTPAEGFMRRTINRKRVRAGLAAAVCVYAMVDAVPSLYASPMVNIVMLGRNLTTGDSEFAPTVAVSPGDQVGYELLTYLAPVGTSNSNGLTVNS